MDIRKLGDSTGLSLNWMFLCLPRHAYCTGAGLDKFVEWPLISKYASQRRKRNTFIGVACSPAPNLSVASHLRGKAKVHISVRHWSFMLLPLSLSLSFSLTSATIAPLSSLTPAALTILLFLVHFKTLYLQFPSFFNTLPHISTWFTTSAPLSLWSNVYWLVSFWSNVYWLVSPSLPISPKVLTIPPSLFSASRPFSHLPFQKSSLQSL